MTTQGTLQRSATARMTVTFTNKANGKVESRKLQGSNASVESRLNAILRDEADANEGHWVYVDSFLNYQVASPY